MTSATAGLRTTRAATRPHKPFPPVPALVLLGQNAARPNTASSAGSRVSPASSMVPMPMASGMPSSE
jgi:hypothetical protein